MSNDDSRPASPRSSRFPSLPGLKAASSSPWWKWALLGIALLGVGYFLGRATTIASGASEAVSGRIKLRPGPWGDVAYLPITIAAPRRLLRVQGVEDEKLEWYFPGMTREDLVSAFTQLGISGKAYAKFTSPSVLSIHPQGVKLAPDCDAVGDLEPSARLGIYQILARYPENNPLKWDFRESYLDMFGKFNVSRATREKLEDVSARYGKFLITYAMSCVLKSTDSEDEKVGVMKALSQQPSMLVRLKVHPNSDVQALGSYWGRGLWSTDVEAILESLRMRPDGGSINILELLPPLPASLLHSYPVPHNYLKGPEVIKNCSWTALNFFRDEPVAEFSDQNYMIKVLANDYVPVLSDPRYGDIALFLTPDNQMRHVAVFLADDLYFTKNGDNPWHPWVYSTGADLIENFSFGLPEGQSLVIRYFRSKNY
ncbi:MAG TPA: hypothetical protein VHO02_07510 [Fibrobacteria bacterium]|jgi:hypothetical protein|nr:hypothetical protein [Fibrobacteria bacterium]